MSIISLLGILSVVNENSCFVDAQKSQTTLLRRRDREQRNKFEKNQEPHRLQTIEPIEEGSGDDKALSLDAGKLSQIKDEYTLKQNANLEIQKISYKIMSSSSSEQEEQTNKIKIDGEEFSLEGASPFNIFSSDAKYLIDGIEQPKLPTVNTFTKVYQDNSIVLITREDLNEQKKITSISYYGPGKSVDLVNINPMQDDLSKEDDAGIFVTIRQDDIDFDKLNLNFRFADRLNGDEDQEQDIEEDELAQFFFDPHRLKKKNRERFQDENTGKDYDNRDRDRDLLTLQYSSQEDFFNSDNICFSYKEIELAVAFDTSFCVEHGGSQRATDEIQRILSGISIRYQQNGLCAYIKATHIEGYCSITSDPYKSMIASNLSGCGSIGLLDKFQDYWNMFRRTIRRDTAHMFSGTGLECDGDGCVIGCANVRCLCSDEAYGVNYVTYNSNPTLRTVLVAHELGHNTGATHIENTKYIMNPFITIADRGFSQDSISAMRRHIDRLFCLKSSNNVEDSISEEQNITDILDIANFEVEYFNIKSILRILMEMILTIFLLSIENIQL